MIAIGIPSAKDIDYANADEICGYHMLLSKIFEKAGGFGTGPLSEKEIAMVRREGVVWLRATKQLMADILSADVATPKLGDLPRILASYDLIHRICHGAPCFPFIREITFRAADRWSGGDKSMSGHQLALMLLKEIRRDIRGIPQRYTDFALAMLDTWVSQLRQNGTLCDITPEETYQVLSALLWQDLSAHDVTRADKLRWIETHTLTPDRTARLDASTLLAYADFTQKAAPLLGKSLPDQDAHYATLLALLAAHPTTHPYLRQAIALM